MNETRVPVAPKVPEVAVVQGKVGVFIGTGYRLMPIETTRAFIARLVDACDKAERSAKT